MASNFYRSQDAPEFLLGHGLEIMLTTLGLIAIVIIRYKYKKINKQREEEMLTCTLTDAELSELGDRAPTFRYKL
jgi:hypothetical protein